MGGLLRRLRQTRRQCVPARRPGSSLDGAKYFLTLLGSSLFWQQTSALLGGLFIACLALVSLGILASDKKLAQHSFWVSLLYSLLMLAAITVGRAGLFGPLQALASRYTTFSILAVASVYAVLAKMAFESRSFIRAALLVPLCGAVLISAAVSYPDGVGFGSATKAVRERAAFVLSTYDSQPDRALMVSLDARAEVIRQNAPVLQRLGYNVFSEPQRR